VKLAAIIALVYFSFSTSALAFCKYQAADGTWTYAKSCAPMPEKEISESATLRLKQNATSKKPASRLEGKRLQGFEYSDTTHSGMRIRVVEPNKMPTEEALATQ
jgi:hypothetical protein